MLNPDYRDILSAFSEEKVEFLLVGAYALAVHGLPRATGDIDLWVRPSPENAQKVLRALATFGAPLSQISPDDLSAPDMVFQIGVVPRRIDILTSISGVAFDDAWPDKMIIEIDEIYVPVISRDHLIQNKQSIGRLKDDTDAQWLKNH